MMGPPGMMNFGPPMGFRPGMGGPPGGPGGPNGGPWGGPPGMRPHMAPMGR